jgi:hypothetical protein
MAPMAVTVFYHRDNSTPMNTASCIGLILQLMLSPGDYATDHATEEAIQELISSGNMEEL